MPAQQVDFQSIIRDRVRGEQYHALVTIRKTLPISRTWKTGTLALAHIFITPVSGQMPSGWQSHYSVHNHFILENLNGKGRYIIRDPRGNDVTESAYSIWDLGLPFATTVMSKLQDLS